MFSRPKILTAVVLSLIGVAPLPGSTSSIQVAQQNLPTVISIGDGDTLRVRRNGQPVTVRLACVDAPEIAQKPWGERSKYRLGQFLPAGTPVRLREVDRDRYGRTVAEVFKGDQSINLQMVREGYAVIYPQYFGSCAGTRGQYLQAEANAKRNRLAFWSQSSPVLPWNYRAGNRTPTPQPSPVTRTPAPSTPAAGTPLRESVSGSCQCPYDYDSRGRRCGRRSAYSRPGGESPRCYVGDN